MKILGKRERVIYDIERCISNVPDACLDCSRYGKNTRISCIKCMEDLMNDALELLKERESVKWIKISPAGIYECSGCGQNVMTSDIDSYKYCHGCGRLAKK